MDLNEYTKVKKIVYNILLESPYARDSDPFLAKMVWQYQNPDIQDESALQFLEGLIERRYFNYETIRRSRQWLQEHKPKTRGQLYQKRHRQGDNVRANLNQLNLGF